MDATPLENAIRRLEEGLARHRREPGDTQLRDGLIQRFEFTYELAHKTLKRHLESISPDPAAYDAMPFQDIIRSANEAGLLLGDWPAWRGYREMRGKACHAYSECKALEVVAGIPGFLREASFLRDRLRERRG